jgi:hypothetical protein
MQNEDDYTYINSLRTDEELKERIDNRQNYMPETVDAALIELQKRGVEFTDQELDVIHADVRAHRQNAAMVDGRLGFFNSNTKNVVTLDPDAPSMYSRRALYVFTVFFGALFGSIMLAMNISKTAKAINAVWVILFGAAFTGLQVYIMNTYAQPGSGGSGAIIGGLIAAYCLDYLFWKNFIGYATFYRAKPIWVPLAIGVVIIGLLVLGIIYGGAANK